MNVRVHRFIFIHYGNLSPIFIRQEGLAEFAHLCLYPCHPVHFLQLLVVSISYCSVPFPGLNMHVSSSIVLFVGFFWNTFAQYSSPACGKRAEFDLRSHCCHHCLDGTIFHQVLPNIAPTCNFVGYSREIVAGLVRERSEFLVEVESPRLVKLY